MKAKKQRAPKNKTKPTAAPAPAPSTAVAGAEPDGYRVLMEIYGDRAARASTGLFGRLTEAAVALASRIPKKWADLREHEQAAEIHAVERQIRRAAELAIADLVNAKAPRIAASIVQVVFKDGIRATLEIPVGDPSRLVLADAVGGKVVIVVPDYEGMADGAGPQAAPDQPELPLGGGHAPTPEPTAGQPEGGATAAAPEPGAPATPENGVGDPSASAPAGWPFPPEPTDPASDETPTPAAGDPAPPEPTAPAAVPEELRVYTPEEIFDLLPACGIDAETHRLEIFAMSDADRSEVSDWIDAILIQQQAEDTLRLPPCLATYGRLSPA